MKQITLATITREYKNNGQHAEQVMRYTLTGEMCKADNRQAPDVQGIQVKSARATICKGTDIAEYVGNDTATAYAYVTGDYATAYIMTPAEYVQFAQKFATVTRESTKNGGAVKTRFKHETTALLTYLAERV